MAHLKFYQKDHLSGVRTFFFSIKHIRIVYCTYAGLKIQVDENRLGFLHVHNFKIFVEEITQNNYSYF